MKAVQIPTRGARFEVAERDCPEAGPGMVRIRVEASGVCHGEVMAIDGHYPGMQYPRIPGHEVVGIVDQVGGGVQGLAVGDRVGVGWSGGGRRVTGLTQDGGYAQWMVAYAEAVVFIPDHYSSQDAAPLLCAGVTTFSALQSMKVQAGDRVAIQGIGGLGHLALQYASRMGFDTVALSRGRSKESLAKQLGARAYYDTTVSKDYEAMRSDGGFQAILATAPSAEAIGGLIDLIAPGGEMVVVAGDGRPFQLSAAQLLNGRRTIRGWTSRGRQDIENTLKFSAMTEVKPMIETFPLSHAQEAFDHMMASTVRFRSVLIPD